MVENINDAAVQQSQLTFGAVLNKGRGHAPGFDAMRQFLSLGIVLLHTLLVCYGVPAMQAAFTGWSRPIVAILVPAFFAFGGFLVAGSLERVRTPLVCLIHRGLRIFPALICVILASALIVGPIFTTAPLRAYFLAPDFSSYLLGIIGKIHYTLPGVFQNGPAQEVNAQLWTVPWELKVYLGLGGLVCLGVARNKWIILGIFVALMTGLFAAQCLGRVVWDGVQLPGYMLGTNFIGGIAAYLWRDSIRVLAGGFVLACLVLVAMFSTDVAIAFSPIFVVYAAIYLGMQPIPRLPLLRQGDYSYGIYLYGFPIQQSVAHALSAGTVWWVNIMVALPLTVGVAMLSWHFVEAPCLRLKRRLHWLSAWEEGAVVRLRALALKPFTRGQSLT